MANLLVTSGSGTTLKRENGLSQGNTLLSIQSGNASRGLSSATISANGREQNVGGVLGGLGYVGEKIGLGALSWAEGIWDYTAGGLAALFGADDWAEKQIANDWVNYNDADEWFNPTKGWQVAGDVAQGIGNSLPSIAVTGIAALATGGLSLGAQGAITFLTSGLSAAGQGVKEAYRSTGKLTGKEWAYGTLSGATEGTIETFSDTVLGLGTGVIKKVFAKDLTKAIGRESIAKTLVKGFAGEALEEAVGGLFEPVWAKITYDPEAKTVLEDPSQFRDIGYQALIGGLSGLIMTGANALTTRGRSTALGRAEIESGRAQDVLNMAKEITNFETLNKTKNEALERTKADYEELIKSVEKTNGKIQTIRQKMLVGELSNDVAWTSLQPVIINEASRIVQNPVAVAGALTDYFETQKGNTGEQIVVTPAELTEGVDFSDKKKFQLSLQKALRNNTALRTVAILNVTNRLTMDTESFERAFYSGVETRGIVSDENVASLMQNGTDAQKNSLQNALGIRDIRSATAKEISDAYVSFARRGGVEAFAKSEAGVKEALAIPEEKARTTIPMSVAKIEDGAVRYSQSGVDFAVIKNGESYRIYDYTSKLTSVEMNREQASAVVRELRNTARFAAENGLTREQTSEKVNDVVGVTESDAETIRIDNMARANVDGYSEMEEGRKQTIRDAIVEAEKEGKSREEVREVISETVKITSAEQKEEANGTTQVPVAEEKAEAKSQTPAETEGAADAEKKSGIGVENMSFTAKELFPKEIKRREELIKRREVKETAPQAKEVIETLEKENRVLKMQRAGAEAKNKKYRSEIANTRSWAKQAGQAAELATKIRDMKKGIFVNATQYKSDIFKDSIEKLARVNFRGNLNVQGTRQIISGLREWYSTDNPMLKFGEDTSRYNEDIAAKMSEIANGEGKLTVKDLETINKIMSYFINFEKNYNKVFFKNKWQDAPELARNFIEKAEKAKKIKDAGKKSRWRGFFIKLSGSKYYRLFGDPMAVARAADLYIEDGYWQSTIEEFRRGAEAAELEKYNALTKYREFFAKKENRNYLAEMSDRTLEYRGTEIPKDVYISLYMTLGRSQAQKGFAENGFFFYNKDGEPVRVEGGMVKAVEGSEGLKVETSSDVREYAKKEREKLKKKLTQQDLAYIAILEEAYNGSVKEMKRRQDIERMGYSNAIEGYYYPIRRAHMAKSIDNDFKSEFDHVSSASFNQNTVQGAKQELFIDGVDKVFNRHVSAVSLYANLSSAIEAYKVLFNADVMENANKPVTIATETESVWREGNDYMNKLILDLEGARSQSEIDKVLGFLRGGFAKGQLGANPKVWVTQLESFFASTSILSPKSIAKGIAINTSDVDKYCPTAMLRNQDNSVAKATGLIENVGKVSDALMTPIGKVDRFVVKRLFGACQVEVADNGGPAVGTEENKVKAGKLLRTVILETQQNESRVERSAAMRSGSEALKTFTMFTGDAMKSAGRVMDAFGELSSLRMQKEIAKSKAEKGIIDEKIKKAKVKATKSVSALAGVAAMAAALTQAFKWLYGKKRDEEDSIAGEMIVDFAGNMLGGLPVVSDVFEFFTSGYELEDPTYAMLNETLDAVKDVMDLATSGRWTEREWATALKRSAFTFGQLTGLPVRNVYNVMYGGLDKVDKIAGSSLTYRIDNLFYKQNYQSDLAKAIENGEDAKAEAVMSVMLGEKIGGNMTKKMVKKLTAIVKAGYKINPREIGNSVTVDGETYELTGEQKTKASLVYAKAENEVNKLAESSRFAKLSKKEQADAVNYIFDTYYSKALFSAVGIQSAEKKTAASALLGTSLAASWYAITRNTEGEKDASGKTVSGSKRKKTLASIKRIATGSEQVILMMALSGYTLKDGDVIGMTAEQEERKLLSLILSSKNLTKEEKLSVASSCGFEVVDGKIVNKWRQTK